MSNIFARIHNIPTNQKLMDHVTQCGDSPLTAYKYGHKDARDAACKIVNEADLKIEALEREVLTLKRQLREACELS